MRRRVLGLLSGVLVLAGLAGAAGAAPTSGPTAADRKRVVVGADGWLFSSQDWTVPCQDAGRVTEATVAALQDVGRELLASGRPVVTTIGPDKSTVLTGALPAAVPAYWCHAGQDRVLWEGATSSPSFLDLRPPLRRAGRDAQAYFRKDTHWTHAGDAVFVREVARRFDPSLPLALDRTTSTATVKGDLASVLRMPPYERVVSTTTVAGRVQVTELPRRSVGLTHPVRTFRAVPSLGGRVLPGRTVWVGDSFTAVAAAQLAQLSEETVLVWVDSRAPLQPLLDELAAADRVVVESVERLTTRFRMWRPDVVAGVSALPRREPALQSVVPPLPR